MLNSTEFVTFDNTTTFSYYGYVPSKQLNLAAVICFAIVLGLQVMLALRYKQMLFSLFFVVGLGLQLGGYICRYQAATDPSNLQDFQTEFVLLTSGPAYMTNSLYQILPQLAALYGKEAMMAHPIVFHVWFFFCSISTIVLQTVGGSFIKGYVAYHYKGHEVGTTLVIAGLSVQIGFMLLYGVIAFNLFTRIKKYCQSEHYQEATLNEKVHNHSKLKYLIFTLTICYFCILLRTIVRLIGMAQGLTGNVMTHEGYQLGLEALPIFIGALAVSLVHPGHVMGRREGGFLIANLVNKVRHAGDEESAYPLRRISS